jgi:hypothetical protein
MLNNHEIMQRRNQNLIPKGKEIRKSKGVLYSYSPSESFLNKFFKL